MARRSFKDLVFKNATLTLKGFDTLDFFTEDDFPLKPYKDNNYFVRKANFIFVEMVLTATYLVKNEPISNENVDYIFSGLSHNFERYTKEQQKVINIALMYLEDYKGKKERSNLIDWYLSNSACTRVNQYMLFKSDGKEVIIDENGYNIERFKLYKQYLCSSSTIGLVKNDNKSTGFEIAFDSIIRDKIIATDRTCDIVNDVLENKLKNYVEELVKINTKFKYIEDQLLNEMVYYSVKNNGLCESDIIRLKEITHICGKTGSGKSVFIDFIVYILAKHSKRVLLLTSKHSDGIKMKEKYEKMGFKATVIVGHKRTKYIDEFISTKMKEDRNMSIFDIIKDNSSVISNLDTTCMKKFSANDNSDNKVDSDIFDDSYKCKDCNDIDKCGYHNLTRDILDSDVLITTAYNLCFSTVNSSFDTYNRSLIEILYAIADFIIVDEADLMQVNFDDAVITQNQVYSKDSTFSSNSYISNILKLYNSINRDKLGVIPFLHKHKAIDTMKMESYIDIACNNFILNNNDEMVKEIVGTKTFTTYNLIIMFCSNFIEEIRDTNNKLIFKNKKKDSSGLNGSKCDDEQEILNLFRDMFFNYLQDEKLKDSLNLSYIDYLSIDINQNLDIFEKQYKRFLKSKYIKNYKIKHNDNGKYNKKKAIAFFNFILFINHLDSYIKHTNILLPSMLMYVNREKHDIPPNALLKCLYLTKSLAWKLTGFSLEKWDSDGVFIHKDFSIIGREILYNTRDYVSTVYDIEPTHMLFVSATSFEENSSRYVIKYPVDYLIKSKLQNDNDNKINTYFCPVLLKQNNTLKPIKVSSSGKKRQSNIKSLCTTICESFLPNLVEESRKIDKGTLFCCSSYEDAYTVYKTINGLRHKGYNIKIQANEKTQNDKRLDDSEIIKISNIEDISNLDGQAIDIAIVIGSIIGRGYNIMNKSKNSSYINNIIILNRMIPSPDDNATNVSYVNSIINKYALNMCNSDVVGFNECVEKSTITATQLKLSYGYRNLNKNLKEAIASNTLVDIRQIVGRGQRGANNNVNLYFLDSMYLPNTTEAIVSGEIIKGLSDIKDDSDTSLFMSWLNILNKSDVLIDELYEDIKLSFNQLEIKEIIGSRNGGKSKG